MFGEEGTNFIGISVTRRRPETGLDRGSLRVAQMALRKLADARENLGRQRLASCRRQGIRCCKGLVEIDQSMVVHTEYLAHFYQTSHT